MAGKEREGYMQLRNKLSRKQVRVRDARMNQTCDNTELDIKKKKLQQIVCDLKHSKK